MRRTQNQQISERPSRRRRASSVLLAAALISCGAARLAAQIGPATVAPAGDEARPVQRQIVISIPDRKLALIENGKVVKIYPVAVGRRATPSPEGTFYIANRVKNPTYYRPGVVIPPGRSNPVGTRWMGLSVAGYGIHGTDEPRSIGRAASHGCIRMRNRDAEDLFARVRVGDVVELAAHADSETLALFHDDKTANPALTVAAFVTGGGR